MKTVILLLASILVFTVPIISCNSNPTTPTTPEPTIVDVSITDDQFQPSTITVNVNDTVKWTNNGVRDHTTTSGQNGQPDGLWDSSTIHPGGTYSRKFTETGTFNYYCNFHWQMGMTGKVKAVQP